MVNSLEGCEEVPIFHALFHILERNGSTLLKRFLVLDHKEWWQMILFKKNYRKNSNLYARQVLGEVALMASFIPKSDVEMMCLLWGVVVCVRVKLSVDGTSVV